MSYRMKISPPLGHYADRAKHTVAIRKLEDACDEAVLQFVNNSKPDREKILDGHLAKAEESIQFHIRALNKLESTDFGPVKESTSKIKKAKDKISNPKEIAKIKLKIHNDLLFDLDIISESSKNIPEANNFGRPSLIRKASPLDHQATGNFGTSPKIQKIIISADQLMSRNGGYIGNTPQLELDKKRLKIDEDRLALERERFELEMKNAGQSNESEPPDPSIEDPFKGCDPSNICRKLLAKEFFKKFAKKNNYKEGSVVNDRQVGADFKKSKDYENLQTKIDQAMADYEAMPLEEREKAWDTWNRTLKGKQPYKLKMPSDGSWVNIRGDVWEDMKIKKGSVGHP